MSRALPVLFACAATAACDRAPVTISVKTPAASAAPRARPGTPHGSVVELVAVTEAGDVALTADDVGTVRLWPALDGTRQAIPIAALAPRELALAASGDELVAGVLDQARTVHVLRIARDGTIRGRAQLGDGAEVRQVIAAGGDLLVRRADESIERYDGSGTRRGRIVASPGERIGTIAARGSAAIVSIVAGDASDAHAVRWIELGDELAWGDELALPAAIAPGTLALAPGRRRLAALSAKLDPKQPAMIQNGVARELPLQIFQLGATITPYAMPGVDVQRGAVIGFIDDDHVAVENTARTAWWIAAPHDPWSDPGRAGKFMPFGVRQLGAAAIADRVAIAGYAAGLELENSDVTRYLGWGALSFGQMAVTGDRITDGPADGKFVWLDDRLVDTRTIALDQLHQPPPHMVTPIGEHELAIAYIVGDKARVELVDVAKPERRFALGDFDDLERLELDPARGMLAVVRADRVIEWQVDVAKLTAQQRQTWRFEGPLSQVRLLGDRTIVTTYDENGQMVRVYRDGGESPDSAEVIEGTVIGIDDAGTIYERPKAHPTWIVAHRDGQELAHFELPGATDTGAVSHAGGSVAIVRAADIALVDSTGAQIWQHPVWRPQQIAFTGDDRRLIVRTGTGIVALDAATGEEVARACGWQFGLHETPLSSLTYGQPPVCEDDGP